MATYDRLISYFFTKIDILGVHFVQNFILHNKMQKNIFTLSNKPKCDFVNFHYWNSLEKKLNKYLKNFSISIAKFTENVFYATLASNITETP